MTDKPDLRRCRARVGRRRCKCLTRDTWEICHNHWRQRIALLTPRASTLADILDAIDGMPTGLEGGIEYIEANKDSKTLTVTDMAGAVFVFSLSKRVKALPYKVRVQQQIDRAGGRV